jgi:hypothetical protein
VRLQRERSLGAALREAGRARRLDLGAEGVWPGRGRWEGLASIRAVSSKPTVGPRRHRASGGDRTRANCKCRQWLTRTVLGLSQQCLMRL